MSRLELTPDHLRKFDITAHPGRENLRLEGDDMQYGAVKWLNRQKGFGFIQPDEDGADVFVHISAVERGGMASLHEGQKIGFVPERSARNGKTSAEQLQTA